MIQLSSFLWMMVFVFAVIGYMRGWTKELIATAGIVLALFALKQFEALVIDPLTDGRQEPKFYLQATILLLLAFFAYQTPPERLARGGAIRNPRESLQDGILGALVGAFNGYLLIGSLWWYMDNLEYPLSPFITPVAPGSASAEMVDALPLSWMLSADGGLLSLVMIALFIFVIVAIV
ncbi:MAG: CvpA family protein [Chloroflexota bacterium]